jgi:dipeptidyl aminopeptidase/acylaminoacyl peptidase
MAPFNQADKIDTPLLLIHGEADNNTGARSSAAATHAHAMCYVM